MPALLLFGWHFLLLIIFRSLDENPSIGLSVPIGVEVSGVTVFGQSASCHSSGSHFKHNRNFEYHITYQGKKMIDIMESDYIRFCKGAGRVKPEASVFHHGIRNVLLPAMTLQFASVSEIIGGSVLVEQVFSYPGLGQAAVSAGLGSDIPLLMGITMISAAMVFAGNFIADILYEIIDPRMRRGAK